jgi:hypothetical protein
MAQGSRRPPFGNPAGDLVMVQFEDWFRLQERLYAAILAIIAG